MFLHWDLSPYNMCKRFQNGTFPHLSKKAHQTRFPVRLLKYWWVACKIQEELENKQNLIVGDIGCGSCQMKMMADFLPSTTWIGTDLHLNEKELKEAEYDSYFESDLTKNLPIEDDFFDIVINSHVLEHLPNPKYSLGELYRIVKPGGILLLGIPVSPGVVVPFQKKRYAKELRAGKRKIGDHIQAFSAHDAIALLKQAGFSSIEGVSGTYFMRKQGFVLENYAWWIRLNQLFGAIFPSFGQELCIVARK